jgi:hypothetical protein
MKCEPRKGKYMVDDKVRKIAEEALNRPAAELEFGRSEKLKNHLAAMGRFARPPRSVGLSLLVVPEKWSLTKGSRRA